MMKTVQNSSWWFNIGVIKAVTERATRPSSSTTPAEHLRTVVNLQLEHLLVNKLCVPLSFTLSLYLAAALSVLGSKGKMHLVW